MRDADLRHDVTKSRRRERSRKLPNMKWGDVQLRTSADGKEFCRIYRETNIKRAGTEPKDTGTVKDGAYYC